MQVLILNHTFRAGFLQPLDIGQKIRVVESKFGRKKKCEIRWRNKKPETAWEVDKTCFQFLKHQRFALFQVFLFLTTGRGGQKIVSFF